MAKRKLIKKKLTKQFIYFLLVVIITLGISISVQSLLAEWKSPITTPPDGNLSEPINVSDTQQNKAGYFSIGTADYGQMLTIRDNTDGVARIKIADFGQNPELQLQYGNNPDSDHWAINNEQDGNKFNIWGGGANRLTILQNGYIGIGTTSPGSILDVAGVFTVRGTTNPPVASIGQGRIYFDSSKKIFMVSENSGDYSSLASIGNQWTKTNSDLSYNDGAIGIGIKSPNSLLHLYKADGNNAELDIQSVAGLGNHWGIYQASTTGDLRFWQGDDRMVITKDGNIGIGTTEPGYLLDIRNQNITGTAAIRLNQDNATAKLWTGTALARQGNEKWFLGMNNKDDQFSIRRNNAFDDFVIDASGNISIGDVKSSTLTLSTFTAKQTDYKISDYGYSYSVAIGDLNGDGKADLVAPNTYYDGTLSVLINNGNGTFATKVNYSIDRWADSVDIGDLNGDGKADLVVTSRYNNYVSVLINNGNGTFAAKVNYSVGGRPYSVAIGDLNGDGKADLAVANKWSNYVSVLINNGNGTFADKVDYFINSWTSSVAIGDLNGDSKTDLVVAAYNNKYVSVLINNGNGTFAAKVDYFIDSWESSVAIGDLNGDNKADLVVANYDNNNISVLINNGNGIFAAKVDYPTSRRLHPVVIGDLNGDGKVDLAGADYEGSSISVLMNNNNGTFSTEAEFPIGGRPHSIVAGDLNGDGRADLVVTKNVGNVGDAVYVSVLLDCTFGTVIKKYSKLYIQASNGNVGIGTTEPGYLLDIRNQNITGTTELRLNQDNATKLWTGTALARQGNEKWFLGMNNKDDQFSIRRNNAFDDFVIDASGNIGVGSTTPTGAKLVVNGTISALTPTANDHVATKGYVDARISSSNKMQTFTSSETWIKPTGVTMVYVTMVGGGGGGGGGSRQAWGTVSGGGGGAGAGIIRFPVQVSNNVVVTIGNGGSSGGAGSNNNLGYGSSGGNGGSTSFGSIIVIGGNGGTAGGNRS